MSFSVKSLFGATTVVAVAVYLLVAAPTIVVVPLLVLLHAVFAASLLAGLVYGTGKLRAFCIGAMIPSGATIVALTFLLSFWLTAGPWETKDWSQLSEYLNRAAFTFRVWSGASWIMGPVLGLLSLAARRTLESRKRDPRDAQG